jgi:hypothetical protein
MSTTKLNNNQVPAIANVPTALSQLFDDSTHRLVTDAEKNVWNSNVGIFNILFYKSNGTQDNIACGSGALNFYLSNGTQDNIVLV